MAIAVRDLYFSYTKVKPTLNGVNLNVDEGSIFALLGPSGCGKTTLLDIIIGARKPKSGDVLLYGYKTGCKESGVPGAGIGFMPQDISLQFDLTIDEILRYFGSLQMMSANEIRRETERLMKTFNLPNKKRLIANLSGGQQRLVSLAIALIHKPRLLILDEPTVGVDPLLRITFWDYLTNLCVVENVTTVITTHYIDEAKRANVVAFMRKGEILCQGKPRELLRKNNSTTLDDVFLLLCSQQGPRRQSLTDVVEDKNSYDIDEKKPLNSRKQISSLRKFSKVIWILIWKHFIEFKRNPTSLLMLFFITFTTIIAVTFLFGNPPKDIPVAWVVDEMRPNCDFVECIEKIEHESGFNATHLTIDKDRAESINSTSSDDFWKDYVGYIPYLPDTLRESIDTEIISLIDYSNISIAMQDFQDLRVAGVIHVGADFSENFLRCDPLIIFDSNCDSKEMIESGTIKLFLDESNAVIYDSIKISVEYSVLYTFRDQVVKQINVSEHVAKIPLSFRNLDESMSSFKTFKLVWFVIPAFLVILPFGFSAANVLIRLVSESDLKVRNYVSGATLSQVFLSEIITQFLIMSCSSLFNLFITIYLFNVPCESSIILVITIVLLQVLLGLTLGLFLSTMFTKSFMSLMTALMVLVGTSFTSGMLWSIEGQPTFIQYVNFAFPFLHSVKSMRTLMLKNDAQFHPQISNGFVFSILWIIIFYIAALLIAKFKK